MYHSETVSIVSWSRIDVGLLRSERGVGVGGHLREDGSHNSYSHTAVFHICYECNV